jgi:hypothetical protein
MRIYDPSRWVNKKNHRFSPPKRWSLRDRSLRDGSPLRCVLTTYTRRSCAFFSMIGGREPTLLAETSIIEISQHLLLGDLDLTALAACVCLQKWWYERAHIFLRCGFFLRRGAPAAHSDSLKEQRACTISIVYISSFCVYVWLLRIKF